MEVTSLWRNTLVLDIYKWSALANIHHNSFSLDLILIDLPPGPLSSWLPACAGSDLHQCWLRTALWSWPSERRKLCKHDILKVQITYRNFFLEVLHSLVASWGNRVSCIWIASIAFEVWDVCCSFRHCLIFISRSHQCDFTISKTLSILFL